MLRLVLIVGTAMVVLSSLHAQQVPVTKPPDTSWPPEGVFMPGGDVTPPRLLARTEPKFTVEAMRRKIQGVVILALVVQADGTVGTVQVRQSLGFGLDDEAVIAARQWKFAPGMRNGVPVPVAATVNLAFSIRGVPPPSNWPEAFVDSAATSADAWTEDRVEGEGLVISVAYPAGWTARKDATPTRLMGLYHEAGTRALMITRPRQMAAPFPQPFPIITLQQFADRMQATSGGRFQRKAFGQGLVNDRWWVWLDLYTPTLAPELVQVSQDAFAGMRMWVLVTMLDKHEVTVISHTLLPRDASPADTELATKQAGAELFAILKRISIRLPSA